MIRSKSSLLVCGSVLAFWASAAQAQVAPADSPTPGAGAAAAQQSTGAVQTATGTAEPGDVVVTAQRRNELQVDVPMSVSVLSGENLAKAGVVSVHDIAAAVPGVQINFAGCCTQPAIRGISTLTTGIGFENNVALYVDGFYTPDNVTINSDLANISSVEVLKGPQGTLWGRNATGGAILINTLAPSATFTGKGSIVYGRFDDLSASGYVSGPITDSIRFGVAGYVRKSDGYNKLLDANGQVVGDATPQRQRSLRVKLEADVTSNLKATLGYNYGYSSDGRGNLFTIVDHASPLLPASPPRASTPFVVSVNRPTELVGSTNEGTLKLALSTGIGTITSYTGYAHRSTLLAYDFDGSYLDLNGSRQDWSQKTVQQAVDYNITAVQHLDLVVGGSYYSDSLHTNPYQLGFGGGVVNTVFATKLNAESYAFYADGSYHLTDRLVLSAGGRYTHETKKASFVTYSAAVVPLLSAANQASFSAFTPRGSIRYEIAPRTNVYATISRGFRSGGFQPNGAASQALYLPFDPEKITSYEVGFKTETHKLHFNIAGFYYDYRNLQVGVTVPNPNGIAGSLISKVTNASRAKVYGVDGDVTYAVSDHFNIHVGGAYLHGRYTDFHNATGTGLNPTTNLNVTNQAQDWTGQQMTRSPSFSAIGGADYTIQDVAGGSLELGANAHYTSSYITNNASLYGPLAGALANQQRYRQGAYVLLNLQVNWTDASGKLHLGVFGNNVTDKLYRLTYSGGAFGDYSSYAAPATWGIRAGVDF